MELSKSCDSQFFDLGICKRLLPIVDPNSTEIEDKKFSVINRKLLFFFFIMRLTDRRQLKQT